MATLPSDQDTFTGFPDLSLDLPTLTTNTLSNATRGEDEDKPYLAMPSTYSSSPTQDGKMAIVPNDQDTFTRFPDLPLELRRKIWREALLYFDRVIEFELVKWRFEGSHYFYDTHGRAWHIRPTSIPTLLSINHESRIELLLFYSAPFKLQLWNKDDTRETDQADISKLLINLEYDTVFLHILGPLTRPLTLNRIIWELFGIKDANEKPRLTRFAGTAPVIDALEAGVRTQIDIGPFASLDELLCVYKQYSRALMPEDVKVIRLTKNWVQLDKTLDDLRKATWIKSARVCNLMPEK